MPYQPAANGAGLLAALLQPRQNWAARSAARQEALQLSAYDAALKEQQLTQEQAAAAKAEEGLRALRSLPFMGKDVQKLREHVKGEEKELFTRLHDVYGGNLKRWADAEGQAWLNGAASRLQNAPFYAQAVENIRNVMAAQQAATKGEFLVGGLNGTSYQTGEQRLQDFLQGRADAFQHVGSYKLSDNLKGLREKQVPGLYSWQSKQYSPEEIHQHLVEQNGESVGTDMFLRHFKDATVFSKAEPLNDKLKLQLEQGRFALDQGRFGLERQRVGIAAANQASMNALRTKQGKLLDAKLANETGQGATGQPFDWDFLANASDKIPLQHEAGTPKKLPNSGIDVGGITDLAGRTLFGDADEAWHRQLGLNKPTKTGDYGRGNITEGFTDQNGVHALDLKNANFTVVGVEPKMYYSTGDVKNSGKLNPNGVRGYARVKIKLNDNEEAYKLGLYNVWTGFGTTKAGTGVYNPDDQTATLFVPAGYVDGLKNKPLMKAIQRSTMGTKAANEAQSDADYQLLNFDTNPNP